MEEVFGLRQLSARSTKVSLALFLLTLLLVGGSWWWLPPEIPLFFSRPTGLDQLTSRWFFFLLPIVSGLFMSVNWYLSRKKLEESVVLVLFEWVSTLSSFLLLVACAYVLYLVF